MRYAVHPKVTLERVAGQYLLISYGGAQPELPYIQQINETGAFYWKLLEERKSDKQMLAAAAEEFGVEAEVIEPGLRAYLEMLSARGYLSPIDSRSI